MCWFLLYPDTEKKNLVRVCVPPDTTLNIPLFTALPEHIARRNFTPRVPSIYQHARLTPAWPFCAMLPLSAHVKPFCFRVLNIPQPSPIPAPSLFFFEVY
jgi:hypothetical protein